MSVNFRCLTIVLALAMMAALIAPVAATSQEEGGPPIYVWINQLAAQPGQSDALTAMLIEQGTKSYAPLLESGAAVNWGVAMNVVHDGGDATSHVEWISFVGWKAVDEFMAGFMAEMQAMTEEESAAQRAAWTANVVDGSHFDIINRSVIIGGKLTGRPSYIHLGYFDAAPGMDEEVVSLFEEMAVPTFDGLVEDGAVRAYGLHAPAIHRGYDWSHMMWYSSDDLAARDAFSQAFGKPDEGTAARMEAAFSDEGHVDQILMVIHFGEATPAE